MGERSIVIEDMMPVEIFGQEEENLTLLRNFFPKLKIIARGEIVKLIGDEEDMDRFAKVMAFMMRQFEVYGEVKPARVRGYLEGEVIPVDGNGDGSDRDALVFGRGGKVIRALTPNQKRMVTSCGQNDMVFAIGPAGTGKTY
ncbi:MAG TPA: PhoH family protein, partial [Bacteroidales bacterium]|nr:PhoH family protein [Bacteroidales bacterium]